MPHLDPICFTNQPQGDSMGILSVQFANCPQQNLTQGSRLTSYATGIDSFNRKNTYKDLFMF